MKGRLIALLIVSTLLFQSIFQPLSIGIGNVALTRVYASELNELQVTVPETDELEITVPEAIETGASNLVTADTKMTVAETTGTGNTKPNMNSSVINGSETDESEAPDSEADGVEAPDSETDGAEAPDSETDGVEAPDSETDGAEALDSETDGVEAPDSEIDGAEAPDSETDGAEAPDSETYGAEAPDSETDGAGISDSVAVDPNLKVNIFAASDYNYNQEVGEEIVVYISTEFSEPTAAIEGLSDYATITVPIPNSQVIITDFSNAEISYDEERGLSYRSTNILVNGNVINYRLYGEDGTTERFLEYTAYEGITIIPFKFLFPNGVTDNTSLELTPESDYGDGTLGLQLMEGLIINAQSSFSWDPVELIYGLGQGTAAIIPPNDGETDGALDKNIDYQIKAVSRNTDKGSIYTESYIIENSVTFPAGIYAEGGFGEQQKDTWYDNSGKPIIKVTDEEAAEITPVLDGERIVGFEIQLVKHNESYNSYLNGEIGVLALQEVDSPDLRIILYAQNLKVDIPLFNTMSSGSAGGDSIKNSVVFTAVPLVGSAEHKSSGEVNTTIPKLAYNITGCLSSETESPVPVNGLIEYTINVENTGWGDKKDVKVTSMIPAGASFYSASPGFTLEYNDSAVSSVGWTVDLAGNERLSFTFSVRVNDDVKDGFNIVCDTYVDGNHLSMIHATPLSSLEFKLSTNRDISKMVKAGEDITYTVTMQNTGDGKTVAAIIAPIPAGTRLSDNPDNGSLTDKGLTWALPMDARSEASISYTVTVNSDVANGFDISNMASVNSAFTNMVSLLTPDARVVISETGSVKNEFGDDRVRPGDTIAYTIRLENTGEGNALVNITDAIPVGVILDSESISCIINGEAVTQTFSYSESKLSWNNIFLAANDVVELMFNVEVTVNVNDEEITNRAVLSINGMDSYSNQVTNRVIVSVLSYKVNSDPPIGSSVNEGDTITYTITVDNTGSDVGTALIAASIPDMATVTDVMFNGQLVGTSDSALSIADGFIKYEAVVPQSTVEDGKGTINFSFRITVGDMSDVYRLEQISYINQLDSQMIYHVLPLPVIGQEESAKVSYSDEEGNQIERVNNVFRIEDGDVVNVYDPATGDTIVYDKDTIAYAFKGDYITYEITAYNYGLGRGTVNILDMVPYGTTLVKINDDIGALDSDNRSLTWQKSIEPGKLVTEDEFGSPLSEPYVRPAVWKVSFTVQVNDNLRNGYNIAAQASVNGEAVNRIDFYLPMADVRIEESAETEQNKAFINLPAKPYQLQPVGLGETITYTLSLTNKGLADGEVCVRDQLPPGVIFKGLAVTSGSALNAAGEPVVPALSGINSTTLTWDHVYVRGLAGIDPDIPAVKLVFEVEVYGEEAYQELVNTMMGRDPKDSGDGLPGTVVDDRRDDDFPQHPDGVDINDTEEIFNYAVLSDLADGRNDKFSNTIRHMVVRPILSYTLSATPKDMKSIEEVITLGGGVEEGDKIYYYVDVANSGHDTGKATIYSEIPALTELDGTGAYIVMLDEDGKEIDWTDEAGNNVRRVSTPEGDYFSRPFTDKNGEQVSGIVYEITVPAQTVMRFAFEVAVGEVYDGFRIEETGWVNKLRSRSIYHYSPIPKVTIAKSASHTYADNRIVYGDDVPQSERQFQTLWPNGNLVPFPWASEEGPDGLAYWPGLPSLLSNGVPHLKDYTGAYDVLGPTVVRPGDKLTYYITLWSESSRSVVDVVDVLPIYMKPIEGTARVMDITSADPSTPMPPIDHGTVAVSQDVVLYQNAYLPRYTVKWDGVHLSRTTANMNMPVVLAIDVVAQIPVKNETIISNYTKATSSFQDTDGSVKKVDCISNTVEHILMKSSSDITKSGRAQNGNDPYVQRGERIDYTIQLGNSSSNIPDQFIVTDKLHDNLIDAYNGVSLVNTISAVILDVNGNVVSSVDKGSTSDSDRVFTSSEGVSINLQGLKFSYDQASGTITWEGGFKPGESAVLKFSAFVNPEYSEKNGNIVENQALLNGETLSNKVVHIIEERSVGVAKYNNDPTALLAGNTIDYGVKVTNGAKITTNGILVEDKLSEFTTFVEGSDKITGGLRGYRYGGSDSANNPFQPEAPEYNPEKYFHMDGYLRWVVDLGPLPEDSLGLVDGIIDYTAAITYDVKVNDRILEGSQIGNVVIITSDSRNKEGVWTTDYGVGGTWEHAPGSPGIPGGSIIYTGPGGYQWDNPDDIVISPGGSGSSDLPQPDLPQPEIVTPNYVVSEKYSSVPWDGTEGTKRLNWYNPQNASVIGNGDIIDYYIDLTIPEGSYPADFTGPTSRYVNVSDVLPNITVRKYEDKYLPDEVRRVVGHTVLVGEPEITRSDGADADYDAMGIADNKLYWNFVEVPYGVTVKLHFAVKAEVDEQELTLNRDSQLLIENKALVNNKETNSVFHEIGRPAIVAEKYVGITVLNEETGESELKWVQTKDWIDGLTNPPTPNEQVFVQTGQVIPYKISLGNAGYGTAAVDIRDQINSLLRVVDTDMGTDGATVLSIQALGDGQALSDPRGKDGSLKIETDPKDVTSKINWMEWDDIKVEAGTAVINGMLYNKDGTEDPRKWIVRQNNPDDESTTVTGLNFTITDPVDIIFYVQVIGDSDQGQQIPNHALFNFPYLEDNEMAGMGRTNQVDMYVQRTLLVARQSADPPAIADGAEISSQLEQGRLSRGDNITYTVEVANAGGASGLAEIAFPIPEGMVYQSDGSLYPVLEKRDITRYDINNNPYTVIADVLVWDNVTVPAPDAGRGLLPKATGEVVIGPVTDGEGGEVTYIGIGSVADTYATSRLMPWSEAGRASVTFTLQVAADELTIDEETGEVLLTEGIPNGSRIDSRPLVTEIPVLDFDVPLVNIQPIKVYPAVLTHFVPLADIVGTKTATFEVDGKSVAVGREYVETDGVLTLIDFVKINGELVDQQYLDDIFVERGTEITYKLTAYNFGLSRGKTIVRDQVPLHTEFVEGMTSDNKTPDDDNMILWTVLVPEYSNGQPGEVTKTFTVKVGEDIANGITVENMATIAGEYTNKLIFKTLPPEITATKLVSVNGGEFINSDGITDIFGTSGIPVTVGTEVEYKIVLRNVGEGKGIVRVEDQISSLLQVDKVSVSNGGSLIINTAAGNKVIWENIELERLTGEAELTFKATVGYAQGDSLTPPAQGTIIPNEAIFNNAKQEDLIPHDPDFGGEIGLGLARTNTVELAVQAAIITATQEADKEQGDVLPGDQITYSIVVKNSGGAGKDIIITNPVPKGTTVTSISGGGKNADGGVTWYLTVPPMADPQNTVETVVSFTVRVNDDIANGSQIQNTALVDGNYAVPAAITHRIPLANINAALDVMVNGKDGNEVAAGGVINYTIQLTNSAPVNGTILVTDQVPAGTDLIPGSITASGGVYYDQYPLKDSNGNVVQTLMNVIVWENVMAPKNNGSVKLNFDVKAQELPNGQIIRNTAQYGSEKTNEVTVRTLAPEFTGVLSSDTDVAGIKAGDVVMYSINVTNTGDYIGSVTVTNQIPVGMAYVQGSVSSPGKLDEYNVLTWTLSDIKPGEARAVTYQAKVQALDNGTVVRNNTAQVAGKLINSVNLTVLAPNLEATLVADTAISQVIVGDTIVYTIRLGNTGVGDVSADVDVKIPEGMKFLGFISNEGFAKYSGSQAKWTNVPVTAGAVEELSYSVEVTGLKNNGVPIREGDAMETMASVLNHYTNKLFTTNTVARSFAPEMIYPGIKLQVLGHIDESRNSEFVAAVNGIVNGAERTNGFRMMATVDNTGDSLGNTTHLAMGNYTIQAVLPPLHVYDDSFAPTFILKNEKGVQVSSIPVSPTSIVRAAGPIAFDTLIWVLDGAQFIVPPNYKVSIEFQSKTQGGGNADPMQFTAYLIPNAAQDFNASRVVSGFLTAINGDRALAAYASVFIVGKYTTKAYIEAAEAKNASNSARGDQGANMIYITSGSDINYTMVLENNTSDITYDKLTLIGRMPHNNDFVVINSSIPRQSKFSIDLVDVAQVKLDGKVLDPNQYTIQFSRNTGGFSANDWSGSQTNWSQSMPWGSAEAGQSYRIIFGSNVTLAPGAILEVKVSARAPEGALAVDTAWNSFAYQYRPTNMPGMTLKSEVSVVGVQMAGFNLTKVVNGYYDGSDFDIEVKGKFNDATNVKTVTFNAADITSKDGVIKPVPNLIMGESYTISEPDPGPYTPIINYSNVKVERGSDISLVTVTNIMSARPSFTSIVDDRDSRVCYSDYWSEQKDTADCYMATQKRTEKKDKYAQFSFNGTGITVIGEYSTENGLMDVYIDSQFITTIDLYSPELLRQQIIFTKNDLSEGWHTIKLVCTGNKNPLSKGKWITLDAFEVVGFDENRIDDRDSAVCYSDGWSEQKDMADCYMATQKRTEKKNKYAQLSFKGTGITVIGEYSKENGLMDVFIDGMFIATVDLYSPELLSQQITFTQNDLSEGWHTIKIVCTGNKNPLSKNKWITLDAFEVIESDNDRIDERDSAVCYSDGWSEQKNIEDSYMKTQKRTEKKDKYAQFSFKGTGITVIGEYSPENGLMDVYIDGGFITTVDLYSPVLMRQQVAFTKNDLSDGWHTIKVVCTGDKNPLSKGKWITLDAFEVVGTAGSRIDERDKTFKYSKDWKDVNDNTGIGYYMGTLKTTSKKGSSVEFTFSGTGINIISQRSWDYGTMEVYIDGEYVTTVDLYSPEPVMQADVFLTTGLANEAHTVKLVCTGMASDTAKQDSRYTSANANTIALDAVEVFY